MQAAPLDLGLTALSIQGRFSYVFDQSTERLSVWFGDDLGIHTERRQSHFLVKVEGELDPATVPRLELECAPAADEDGLVFDLSGIRFIDLRGLRSLLLFASASHPVRLLQPSRVVRRLIDLTATQSSFEILESLRNPISPERVPPLGEGSLSL